MTTDTLTVQAGTPVRDRLALAVLLTASFTLAVDFSILNVALPRIGADVGFSLSNLQWISTTFAVCAAGFTLFFGRLADLFGRRRQFLAGVALLGVASLAGAMAETRGSCSPPEWPRGSRQRQSSRRPCHC